MFEYELQIALEAVKEGARALTKHWGQLSMIMDKSAPGDLVTDADKDSENVILSYLKKRFPNHGYIAEEMDNSIIQEQEFVWVLDPLDGTVNYTHLYPMVAISLALLQNGVPVIGIILNPFLDGLYYSVKGNGAFFNKMKIKVSKETSLEKSLLGSGFGYDRRDIVDNNYLEFSHLTNVAHGVRRAGAASLDLAYVSVGRLEGYWERGLKIWDLAAGVLIVEEAGGKVSNYDGSPVELYSGRVVATNGLIHDQLIKELAKCAKLEAEKKEIFDVLSRIRN